MARFLTIALMAMMILGGSTNSMADGTAGNLIGVFQDGGQGDSLFGMEMDSLNWSRVSPAFPDLENPVSVGRREFLALSRFNLVHISAGGTSEVVLAKSVYSFSYNKAKRLIFAVADGPSGGFVLKAITWPDRSIRVLDSCPPLSLLSTVSSQGDKVVIGVADKGVYVATIGEYAFSRLVEGEDPLLSPTSRYMVYLDPETRHMSVLTMGDGTSRVICTDRVGMKTWIDDRRVVYSYSWKFPLLMIQPVGRLAVIDVLSGQRKKLATEVPDKGITWAE